MTADSDSGSRKPGLEELLAEVERLRAEKAILQAELDNQKQKLSRRRFPGRNTLTWIFIALTCSAAILAPIAVWARRSFLDTNNFTNMVAPLVANDTVARSLSDEVAIRVFAHLEIQKRVKEALREALPDKLDFMAGPIAGSLQTLTQKITYEIITSPQFQAAWDRILRLAHSAAVGIIRGDRSLSVSSTGAIVLNTGELMGDVRGRLVASGLGFLENVPIPFQAGEVVLFSSSQLGNVKRSLEILDTLNWLLPLLLLVFIAAAVLVAEDRRRALMWLSVALAAGMVLSLTLLNFAEGELLAEVKKPSNVGAVRVIWNSLTSNLVQANVTLLVLGLVGALAFAAAGPYAWASRTRCKARQILGLQLKRRLSE